MKKIIVFIVFTVHCSLLTVHCSAQWQQTNLDSVIILCLDTSGTNIFAGGSGVFLSTDNGGSWKHVSNSFGVYALAISGINIFAGGGEGVFLSTDNGGSWKDVNNDLNFGGITTIAISGTNIFVGDGFTGVSLSTNNGESWKEVDNGLTFLDILSLAISGKNIFAGVADYTATGRGLFLSTNSGRSWKAVNNGLTDSIIRTLAISGTNIFAGTDGGVFLSTNNGGNWEAMNNGLTGKALSVGAFLINGSNIFLGTYGGVFLSTNNGGSWTDVNSGLANTDIYSLAISGDTIFAGTWGAGIWKRGLSEITGVNELGIRDEELGIKVYPNPVNELSVISYQLSAKSQVNLSIYDVTGRKVSTLVNQEQEKGDYKIEFDAKNLNNGIYFCKLQAGNSSMTRKIIVIH